MTVNVKNALDKICNNEIFKDELYFTGGTALAFYLNHRVSEDIDIVSSAKLKIVALIMRDKSRDLFDFGSLMEHYVLSIDEIVELFCKIDNKIVSVDDVISFIKSKQEPRDDEAVYLSERDRIDLNFEEIKEQVIRALKSIFMNKVR